MDRCSLRDPTKPPSTSITTVVSTQPALFHFLSSVSLRLKILFDSAAFVTHSSASELPGSGLCRNLPTASELHLTSASASCVCHHLRETRDPDGSGGALAIWCLSEGPWSRRDPYSASPSYSSCTAPHSHGAVVMQCHLVEERVTPVVIVT